MVEIAKTLHNACWYGGPSNDFVKNSLFQNVKINTRAFVELIHDLRDFRLPQRCS